MKTDSKIPKSQPIVTEHHRIIKQSLVTVILVLAVLLILAGVISVRRFLLILAMISETLRRLFEELSGLFP